MRHYVLPGTYDRPCVIELSEQESKYITRVLRKRQGEHFTGVDARGNTVALCVQSVEPGRCLLEITDVTPLTDVTETEDSMPAITLFQCLPKGNKMDLIIRQAVEAGVERIVPVLSSYSVPRIGTDGYEKKRERWMRIAKQAMQQSGRKTMPEISVPEKIAALPEVWSRYSNTEDVCLLFYENQVSQLHLHRLLCSNLSSIGICIGPEGGFSSVEVTNLLNSGLHPVYINTNILRTETAALYAVAAVQTVILEKDSWNIRR